LSKESVPLESTIAKAALRKLNALDGCRAKKHHGSNFGAIELDIYGCYRGLSFFIEMKRPGGKLSDRQVVEIAKWKAVGAATGVAYSAEEALEIIFKAKEAAALT